MGAVPARRRAIHRCRLAAAVRRLAGGARGATRARRGGIAHAVRVSRQSARGTPSLAAIQSEMDGYLGRLQEFAYADGLPRLSVDLHRIVVVPRVLINGAAYGAIAKRLHSERAFASLEGGDAVRDFFVATLIDHLDGAIAGVMPSPKRPLAAGTDWVSVGMESAFVWRLPLLNAPPWAGHHYVLEVTRDPITRAVRKKVVAAVERIEASLPSLSRLERNEILRRAVRAT